MSAPAEALDSLRKVRDEAQRTYAHKRQNVVAGKATKAALDRARAEYMLAQSNYRAALLRNGGAS